MYAQVTTFRVPTNQLDCLREVIATQYLPIIRTRPGFEAGFLLEKDDDANSAQLVLIWKAHADVENFNGTGLLQASLHALAVDVPGIHMQREGYIVKISALAVKSPAKLALVSDQI